MAFTMNFLTRPNKRVGWKNNLKLGGNIPQVKGRQQNLSESLPNLMADLLSVDRKVVQYTTRSNKYI